MTTRRDFLKGLGLTAAGLLVPTRTIFLPPAGGWPDLGVYNYQMSYLRGIQSHQDVFDSEHYVLHGDAGVLVKEPEIVELEPGGRYAIRLYSWDSKAEAELMVDFT